MPAPAIIHDLVKAFERDQRTYYDSAYSEARVRQEYLDPFLKALGWNPGADPRYIEEWRDCIVEKSLDVEDEAHKKRADYTCRIGKSPALIVEAKKPHEDVFEQPKHALQVRRYAYSLTLPLGALTNFAQLAIYDGRVKPKRDDAARVAQLEKFRFTEYVEKWDLIESLLSKDAIMRGAQREYMQKRVARGLIPLDKAILAEIDRWREELAHSVARTNPQLDAPALTEAVARTIDRILFLRVCEARDIEPSHTLHGVSKGKGVYERLKKLFHEADDRYNSGLFYFKKEDRRDEQPDTFTLKLEIEDKPLRQIINGLYYPENLYEFALIPVEILGQVYEQFLGKVIVVPKAGKAKVEDKPEVRKAGGVYYTPTYIVDYIVKHTVGKLVEGKAPKDIEKLRVLDPACGSGSFLLGAYQFLLDWYLQWYKKDGVEKHQKQIERDILEGYRLTLHERKRILKAHIFGVDIDSQAVEVAKLSLLLKVLEGESRETVSYELKLKERALPDLGQNIKCGNSLIGTDFYKQFPDLTDAEKQKVNPFDWKKGFPAAFKDGGFDAVIGNPPWVDIKGMNPALVDYYFSRYKTTQNRMNIYATFMHRALELMSPHGLFGFITPNSFLTQSSYRQLRQWILKSYFPAKIIRLPDRVFYGVIAETAVTIISGDSVRACDVTIYPANASIMSIDENPTSRTDFRQWLHDPEIVFDIYRSTDERSLVGKIQKAGVPLLDLCDFSLGLTPYDKYKGHTQHQIKNRVFHADRKKDSSHKPLLSGADISRYDIHWNGTEWISYGEWLGAPREKRFFTEPRILIRQIISGKPGRIFAGYTKEEFYNTQIAFNILPKANAVHSIQYLLGVLNSKLLSFYHKSRFLDSQKTVFQKILIQDAKQFPIRTINFSDKKDKARHDKMVKLVERMLKLHKDLQSEWVGNKQEAIEREIAAMDEQIDQLVYELYDLTSEEIAIVEGKAQD